MNQILKHKRDLMIKQCRLFEKKVFIVSKRKPYHRLLQGLLEDNEQSILEAGDLGEQGLQLLTEQNVYPGQHSEWPRLLFKCKAVGLKYLPYILCRVSFLANYKSPNQRNLVFNPLTKQRHDCLADCLIYLLLLADSTPLVIPNGLLLRLMQIGGMISERAALLVYESLKWQIRLNGQDKQMFYNDLQSAMQQFSRKGLSFDCKAKGLYADLQAQYLDICLQIQPLLLAMINKMSKTVQAATFDSLILLLAEEEIWSKEVTEFFINKLKPSYQIPKEFSAKIKKNEMLMEKLLKKRVL